MNPVEQYIESQNSNTRNILDILRHFILEYNPSIREKLSHGIPFFYVNKNICYLNPVRNGVDLGFTRGKNIALNLPGFELKDRKRVKSFHFKYVEDINLEAVALVLEEALVLDKNA